MRARLLLLAGALVAFGASLGSGFHFDDYAIFADPVLRSGWGWLQIWSLRQTRPLTYLTFWLNYQVGGRDPLGYHFLNLALHLGVVLLLLRVPAEAGAGTGAPGSRRRCSPCTRSKLKQWITFGGAASCWQGCSAPRRCGPGWTAAAGWRWCGSPWRCWPRRSARPFRCCLRCWSGAGVRRADGLSAGAHAAMLALALAAAARVIYATAVTPGAPAGLQAGISPWKYFLAQGVVIPRYFRLLAIPYGFTVDPEIHVPPVWLGLRGMAGHRRRRRCGCGGAPRGWWPGWFSCCPVRPSSLPPTWPPIGACIFPCFASLRRPACGSHV